MLTLPAEGFAVPANAMSTRKPRVVAYEKARPVRTIRPDAVINSRRRSYRPPMSPIARVSSAEPNKAAVAIKPTLTVEKPSALKYTGSRMATKPSPRSRNARAAKIRVTVLGINGRTTF